MDQPYTKENIEAAMGHVRTLLDQVNALEALFPGRHFTLDGHLVGSLGEIAAAYHYGIELSGHRRSTTMDLLAIETFKSKSPRRIMCSLEKNPNT